MAQQNTETSPWVTLWVLCIGFFMILVDMTIVAVANPAIMADLHSDVDGVIWVTSAYLLTYAVPLLVTGRLGDRFGQKNVLIAGLAVFTLASLWCGLSTSIGMLVAARAVQGLGAALIAPQTMAVITRVFPPDKRGAAMGAWGAVAGIATLVGPILGGLLVDGLGWEWIFFVNVPVGIAAIVLALKYLPVLDKHEHRFDVPGVIVSGGGVFLLVFGLQEGAANDWAPWIWSMIGAGLVVLGGFVVYQGRSVREPLVPLQLFANRNFSVSNVAIAMLAAAIMGQIIPTYFYWEAVRGFSPTEAALVTAPMALATAFLAPLVGKLIDKAHPRLVPAVGFVLFTIGVGWTAVLMRPHTPVWEFMPALILMGIGSAGVWGALAASATHGLPQHLAGAGAGIYNTTRQTATVLGSAAISALLTTRLAVHGIEQSGGGEGGAAALPEPLREPFSNALAESLILPTVLLAIAALASMGLGRHAVKDTAKPAAAVSA